MAKSRRLLKNPGVRQVDHFRQQWQVIAAKAFGLLPLLAILVKTADGDVVASSSNGLVFPNRRLDGAESDFMGGLLIGLGHSRSPKGLVTDYLPVRAA